MAQQPECLPPMPLPELLIGLEEAMSLGEWGMRFGLLGPLHVSRNGAELAVRGGKPRVLLVALLLDAGKSVPAERLAAALWDDPAPMTARASRASRAARWPTWSVSSATPTAVWTC